MLVRAGLRCRLSCAGLFVVSGARWHLSNLLALSRARFVATWRLLSAARSSHAGHNLCGIARFSKQRYRVANRRRNVCRLTSHSSGRLCRRLIPALGGTLKVSGERESMDESSQEGFRLTPEDLAMLEARQRNARSVWVGLFLGAAISVGLWFVWRPLGATVALFTVGYLRRFFRGKII